MKPRIHLIGGPGSGKSYVAAALSARFDVPAYELDELFWERSATSYGVRKETAFRDSRTRIRRRSRRAGRLRMSSPRLGF
jgi:adenylate kinase family enzyme